MNQYQKLPSHLLDNDEYPTEEFLTFIREYVPDDSLTLIHFVERVLIDGWWMPDWGFRLHKKYKGKRKLELHTGGWSGNEETISALLSNIYFRTYYVMWRTGGHYYFEIPFNRT